MQKIIKVILRYLYKKVKARGRFYFRWYCIYKEFLVLSSLFNRNPGVSNEKLSDYSVVISLTTYGRRLEDVYMTIESLMCGSVLPNRIVLWLEDGLKSYALSPQLKKQVKRGLIIRYTKDIRSYKKLIPSLHAFPESIIVTVDDDVFYSTDFLKNLLESYKSDPNYIYANRVHEIMLDSQKYPKPYLQWGWEAQEVKASPRYMLTGVGGVLYPPNCFPVEVFNESVFMDICRYGDDIWFYSMGLINGYMVHKAFTDDVAGNDYIDNMCPKEKGLNVLNTDDSACRNDNQIRKVFNKYGVYTILADSKDSCGSKMYI